MTMVLKFVTKESTKVYGPPYTKQEEAEFYSRNANGPPEHRSIRRRQSQRAPGIREQASPKRTSTVQDFFSKPHFAGRKSLM
jgi:hypothetical protein